MLLYTVFRVFPPKHLFHSICNSEPTPVLQWRLWYLCRKLIGRDESRSQWSEIIVFDGASHLWFFAVLCMKCMHTHIPTSSKGWSHIAFLHTHTHTCICKRRRKWQPTTVFLPGEFHGYYINSIIFFIEWKIL